jgi:hypothetical protein
MMADRYESRCLRPTAYVSDTGDIGGGIADPQRQHGSPGDPCQFNVDCLPGLACYKISQSATEGRCNQPDPSELELP